MGGRLLLESQGPGKAAKATLELPVSQSPDRAAQESQTRKKERTPRLDWARLLHGPPFGGREIRARITPCKLGEAACSREYEGILHG